MRGCRSAPEPQPAAPARVAGTGEQRWQTALMPSVRHLLSPAGWNRATVVFVLTLAALLGLVTLLSYLGHELYEAVTEGDGISVIDHPVLDQMLSLRSPGLTAVMIGLTWAGGRLGVPLLAVAAIGLLTVRRRDWTPTVLVAVTMAGALLVTVVGKTFVGRVRPPAALALPPFETSPSFPSGHTLSTTALMVIVGYLVVLTFHRSVRRHLALVLALLLAVGVGLSRVYLGQHWLTDVFAGWLVGAAWALSVVAAHRIWLRLRSSPVRTDPAHRIP